MTIPFYVMAASVPPGNRVVQFRGGGVDGAAYLLSNVPRFRYASFDVAIPDSPTPGPDDSLELRWGDRKLLRLYQDGALLFRARADHDFLGWGMEPDAFLRFPKLNPVPVVEVHASFVHLYREIFQRLKKPADTILFKLSLNNGTVNGQRLFLTKYFGRGIVDWASVTKYVLQVDPAQDEIEITSEELTEKPNRAAFRVLSVFASWFDMPEDEIPFTRDSPDGREVDLDAIKGL